MASWEIVATVNEPASLVAAFVAHHLAEGAARITLFCDKPAPELKAMMAGQAQVDVREYGWFERRLHPAARRPHTYRQVRNANRLLAQAQADWVLHCDADEFVGNGALLGEMLELMGPEIDAVRLPVRERIYRPGDGGTHIFEGIFRKPAQDADKVAALYGDVADYMNRGMAGYATWKSMVRRGSGLRLHIHSAQDEAGKEIARARVKSLPRVGLHHFDGLTPASWATKLQRKRVMAPAAAAKTKTRRRHQGRLRQIEFAKDKPLAEAVALHDRLLRADAAQLAEMRAAGVLIEQELDPRAAVARLWPDFGAGAFTPAAFDRDFAGR
ncbi:hypothetical protein OG2516_08122 [Oceanicola granulosus HTCC2516]|uniref:Glycosyl transferase family 2 n=1 Tax=Oceanicola granulosus (strain ATCC BAA-861 / DSM 15982 / KCTC 12143 / HTCC2516) TaxID=314256 RepID=Q2CI30_OCEGH|nr:glycosyltransferase family 2 protein [Oceanicola granulosus]EAR52428.1 hypothetical protein OG2516_08122 [Oceanicola granulosus HTCC2516]